MAQRDEIVAFLDKLLDSPGFPDYGPNGLQVPGAESVESVITGVSATKELFEVAIQKDASMVLVHHGVFWGDAGALSEMQAGRLRVLLANDLNLVAYHLPLDAHPSVGNNALLIDELGLAIEESFGDYKGRSIGFVATAPGIGGDELATTIAARLGREPMHLAYGPERIERVAVIAGSAPDYIEAAAAAGCDAFITGEPAERVNSAAKELGIHFYAAGHHATEKLGVQRLGEALVEHFGVNHEFVDIPNPI
ncbi:MAG: Nif3-like dinuclear metal center hexameric protein [Thermoleophilaceae bacterium]|nr:Nif3-like dinuclear metal center hexameric protein [Thermoleophilaceae bacterium]